MKQEPEGNPPDRLLTAAEVAALLQIRPSWVLDAARRNAFPHLRLGRYVRFRRADIKEWLLEQRSGPPACDDLQARVIDERKIEVVLDELALGFECPHRRRHRRSDFDHNGGRRQVLPD